MIEKNIATERAENNSRRVTIAKKMESFLLTTHVTTTNPSRKFSPVINQM